MSQFKETLKIELKSDARCYPMADDYKKWKLEREKSNETLVGRCCNKIQDFFNYAKAVLTKTENAHNVYRKISVGDVWNRTAWEKSTYAEGKTKSTDKLEGKFAVPITIGENVGKGFDKFNEILMDAKVLVSECKLIKDQLSLYLKNVSPEEFEKHKKDVDKNIERLAGAMKTLLEVQPHFKLIYDFGRLGTIITKELLNLIPDISSEGKINHNIKLAYDKGIIIDDSINKAIELINNYDASSDMVERDSYEKLDELGLLYKEDGKESDLKKCCIEICNDMREVAKDMYVREVGTVGFVVHGVQFATMLPKIYYRTAQMGYDRFIKKCESQKEYYDKNEIEYVEKLATSMWRDFDRMFMGGIMDKYEDYKKIEPVTV